MPPEHQPAPSASAAPGAGPTPVVLPKRLTQGLHLVAIFEACKGVIVLAGGLGALGLLNRDAGIVAGKIVRYLLLNPDNHFVQIFLRRASHITNQQILLAATIATLYAATRFVEAYGLWKNRAWGEWIAVFGGMLYIPIEVTALVRHPGLWHAGLLASNVLIVLYVARILHIKQKAREASRASSTTSPTHP